MSGDGESLILFDTANFYFGSCSWQISCSPHTLSVKLDTFPKQGIETYCPFPERARDFIKTARTRAT